MQAMSGRKIGAKVKQRPATLKEQARQAGIKPRGTRTTAPRAFRDTKFTTSAPTGTVPRRNPGAAIPASMKQRRTLTADIASRPARRSKAAAAKAAAADGRMMRGSFARLRRKR